MIESKPAPLETSDLVLQAQAGDEQALTRLLSAHLPLLYNVIGRALNGHQDVDDLVQETVVQAIQGLATLRDPDRFRSWAVSIAYRQIQQHQRSRREVQRYRQEQPADLPDPSADFAERTVSELMLTGQRRELAQATRWLEPTHRQLLALWWQEATGELTRAELSAALEMTPPHAAVRLQRMRRQLDLARTVVRALRTDPRCTELDAVVRNWDGGTAPLWRKRLFRHVRNCPHCSIHEQGLVPPENLLRGVSALALPLMATAGMRVALDGGLPAVAMPVVYAGQSMLARFIDLLHSKLVVATAVVVVAGGGITYAVDQAPGPNRPDVVIVNPTPAPVTTAPARPSVTASVPVATPSSSTSGRVKAPFTGGVASADLYVAPDGSDRGDGSLGHPYASLARAVSIVRPGQTIALRGGTYRPTEAITIDTSGTADQRITISNYRDERPVIDAAGLPKDKWAITQEADYWTVQGLELRNSASHAYVCLACKYDIFQRLSSHDNVESGLTLRNTGTIGNHVLDSDFYNNHDPSGASAGGIGLGIKFGSGTGNVVRGNRAFNNADDGFSLGSFNSAVTIEDNWAYGNGVNRWNVADWNSNGNGFSLGGGSPLAVAAHIVRNNAAWDNIHHGFDDQGNTAALVVRNNTAFRNGSVGFSLPDATATPSANVSVANDLSVATGPAGGGTGNSWNGGHWSADTFASTDPATAQGARRADGSLPRTSYLKTGNGSGASLDG